MMTDTDPILQLQLEDADKLKARQAENTHSLRRMEVIQRQQQLEGGVVNPNPTLVSTAPCTAPPSRPRSQVANSDRFCQAQVASALVSAPSSTRSGVARAPSSASSSSAVLLRTTASSRSHQEPHHPRSLPQPPKHQSQIPDSLSQHQHSPVLVPLSSYTTSPDHGHHDHHDHHHRQPSYGSSRTPGNDPQSCPQSIGSHKSSHKHKKDPQDKNRLGTMLSSFKFLSKGADKGKKRSSPANRASTHSQQEPTYDEFDPALADTKYYAPHDSAYSNSVGLDDVPPMPAHVQTGPPEMDLTQVPRGPPPPLLLPNNISSDNTNNDPLEFESSLDINISTLTSALSTALLRLQSATQPIVCDRDRHLPIESRLATVLATDLTQHYLRTDPHRPHLRIPDPKKIRPRDAAAYLTSLIARHFLTELTKHTPGFSATTASNTAKRAAAREITYHFLRADALGAMHVPLPAFWTDKVAELVDWVELLLADYGVSDSLLTDADHDRLAAAVRACALATAMMRVVHPNLTFSWVCPGVLAVEAEGVQVPVDEWIGGRPQEREPEDEQPAPPPARVAYCMFPRVDESETRLDEAGIWKAVVVAYQERPGEQGDEGTSVVLPDVAALAVSQPVPGPVQASAPGPAQDTAPVLAQTTTPVPVQAISHGQAHAPDLPHATPPAPVQATRRFPVQATAPVPVQTAPVQSSAPSAAQTSAPMPIQESKPAVAQESMPISAQPSAPAATQAPAPALKQTKLDALNSDRVKHLPPPCMVSQDVPPVNPHGRVPHTVPAHTVMSAPSAALLASSVNPLPRVVVAPPARSTSFADQRLPTRQDAGPDSNSPVDDQGDDPAAYSFDNPEQALQMGAEADEQSRTQQGADGGMQSGDQDDDMTADSHEDPKRALQMDSESIGYPLDNEDEDEHARSARRDFNTVSATIGQEYVAHTTLEESQAAMALAADGLSDNVLLYMDEYGAFNNIPTR